MATLVALASATTLSLAAEPTLKVGELPEGD